MQSLLFMVLGSAISGMIGILTVYLTGRLRDQEWKKQNILRPLYNEASEIVENEGKNLSIGYKPEWDATDNYSRMKISQKLQELLDTPSLEIHKWQELASAQATLTKSASISLANKLKDIFPQVLISREDDKVCLLLERERDRKHYIELEKWAEMFGPVLLSRKKGYKLYKALVEYSEERRWSGWEKHLKRWYNEFPQIFEMFPLAVSSIISEVKLNSATAELDDLRENILRVASKVRMELRKKINKIW